MGKKIKDVFISYAVQNEAIVRQIYTDLKRSDIHVWDFKKDGEIGVDFENEFRKRIKECKFFCLIDSPDSRTASYVKKECEYAIEFGKKIIPCKVETGDEWVKDTEIFDRQNFIVRIDFSLSYESAISELCKQLGHVYIKHDDHVFDDDFFKEMRSIRMYDGNRNNLLTTEEYEKIIDCYHSYKKAIQKDKIENAITDINRIIESLSPMSDFHSLKTPYFILGKLYADSNRHKDAEKLYKELCRKYPKDAKTHNGVGGSLFYQKRYKEAFLVYMKAHELLKHQHEYDNEGFEIIIHNLYQTALVLENDDDFISKIRYTLLNSETATPELVSLIGDVHFQSNEIEEAYELYKRSIWLIRRKRLFLTLKPLRECYINNVLKLVDCAEKLDSYEMIYRTLSSALAFFPDNAELCRRYGVLYWYHREVDESIEYYEKAIEIQPDDIKYRAELAQIYLHIDKNEEYQDMIDSCFDIESDKRLTNVDRYYLGLIYYLEGKKEIAERFYLLSQKDLVLKNWEYYDELLN